MTSKWNRGGCNGQCAGYDPCICSGETNSDAQCCENCGLNAAASAGTNTTQRQNSCSCGNAANSSARCCERCGLTINPDGSQMVARGAVRQFSGPRSSASCRNCGCGGQESGGNQPVPPARPVPPPCGVGCHQAVVTPQPQQLGETYAVEEALFQGTLFPELDKPMAAVSGCLTENCATRRQLAAFELWELRLYLDTHPEDGRALQRWQQLCTDNCGDNYATAFTGNCAQGGCWNWTQDPWPWEYQPCRSCGCSN